MKKLNNNGFILAETLVVTVFLMVIFTMLYTNYYPLIGEYQKRETYDDVDGKYVAYWMKKLIEDPSYQPPANKLALLTTAGFMRFECDDVLEEDEARNLCRKLVKAFEIAGCDAKGNGCELYITHYRIGEVSPEFKETVRYNLKKYQEVYASAAAIEATEAEKNARKADFIALCNDEINSPYCNLNDSTCRARCGELAEETVFPSRVQDYVLSLPDFATESQTGAKFRVIIGVKHIKDNNNYHSYSTIEVDR